MLEFYANPDPLFEAKILSFVEGENREILLTFPGILFIPEGKLYVRSVSSKDILIQQGQMLLLSPGKEYLLFSERSSESIIIQIPEIELFCYHFFPSPVFRKQIIYDQNLFSLTMNKHIRLILQGIKNYFQHDLCDAMLLKIRTLEIFHFLASSYPEDLLANFFAPILSPEYIFSRFVLDHYTSVKTVEELAALSHYSRSGFQKQFRKVFGVAPYQWMVMKKTEKVYLDISETTKPLKVIAEEAGFAGLSQLSDFCRKRIGKSPLAIRNKK